MGEAGFSPRDWAMRVEVPFELKTRSSWKYSEEAVARSPTPAICPRSLRVGE
jgi:hypothetical protein